MSDDDEIDLDDELGLGRLVRLLALAHASLARPLVATPTASCSVGRVDGGA